MTVEPEEPREVDQIHGSGFGEELRRCRTAAGLTLRSLAEQVTFDFSYLGQVERGDRGGSIRLARQCDTALGTHGYLIRLFTDQQARRSPTTLTVVEEAVQ